MALGLAPIVANYGGIAEVVTPECGFRIPLTSAEVLTAAMKKALETLVEQPERISSLGQKARERILSEYTWDRKAQRYLEIYAWLGKSQRQRPEQAFPSVRQENETFGDDTPKKVS